MTTRRPIFLIGYRGTGKSTVARLLAERLHCTWLDADVELEKRAGKSIRQIFIDNGEETFRDLESAVLRDLMNATDTVIATGGGVVLREENRLALKNGLVVWLRAPAEVLWHRLNEDAMTRERRPNLSQGGLAEIEEMLRLRTPIYERCADFTVDTDAATPTEIAEVVSRFGRQT
ncbi:MAG: shikimate kinase [Gemmataceae bacterium]|nr:shikimate kinase [Gemmataceae bacterium]